MSAGVTINLKVEIAKAQRAMKKLGRQLDRKVYLGLIGTQLLRWINQNFKDQGTEKKWAPLKPATILARRKGKAGSGAKILQDTGKLRQSFIDKVNIPGGWVKVGTADIRAGTHQLGFAKKNIPARPMLPSEDRGRQIALEELKNYVKIITAEANA